MLDCSKNNKHFFSALWIEQWVEVFKEVDNHTIDIDGALKFIALKRILENLLSHGQVKVWSRSLGKS